MSPIERLADTTNPALFAAAERVLADLPGRSPAEPADGDARREVLWILETARGGEHIAREEAPAHVVALRRRLIELLRAELVRAWSAPEAEPSSGEMLEVLGGLERARAALDRVRPAEPGLRLAGPGGSERLVEVAHDLRSPLTSILFLTETLWRGQSGPINAVQQRQLGIVYSAALGLIGIVSDIIDYARSGDDLIHEQPEPFSITELIESIRDIVQPMAEEKGLALRLDSDAEDHRLGHPAALSRLLLNLTTNALKFTEEGRVEISAHAEGPTRVEFSVRDTGPGMDPDAVSRLYQPFRRSPYGGKDYRFSGSGLGLAVCRRLAEALGSELRLETATGQGTRFSFAVDLPIASVS